MRLATNGVVVNEYGQVLLIRRNDTRTMAPPGGSVEGGELPSSNVAREVREETGLVVMPVRLVGLYFWPIKPSGALIFVFRCIQRGGRIQTSPESPEVNFYSTQPLPGPMLGFHKHRLRRALAHQGGAPDWAVQKLSWRIRLAKILLDQIVYRFLDVRRTLKNQSRYQPPPDWRVSAYVHIRDAEDRVLWVEGEARESWALPGGECQLMEPPWETALRTTRDQTGQKPHLLDVIGVYFIRGEEHFHLLFSASLGNEGGSKSGPLAYFLPSEIPSGTDPLFSRLVEDAGKPGEITKFQILEEKH